MLTDKKCCYINKKQWKRFTKIHKCFKSENHLTAKKNNVTIVAMDNRLRNKKRMTLQDVADALNMSKTTVSRALSGKGRIGEDTRRAVIDFAKEHDYHPNLMAKGLAEAKTWNIGVVLQGNASRADMPFFQNCLFGIASEVKSHNYDVLLILNDENSSDGLLQMLRLGKADAVILTRVMENDKNVELLKEHSIPFVAIGSYNDDSVIQVDAKNEEACRSFTLEIVKRAGNAGKIIFLCGKQNIIVNKMRLNGFLEAMNELGKSDYSVTLDIESAKEAKEALSGFDGSIVICADDVFLGPSCVFTNVINPRSAVSRKDSYRRTMVGKGATIGANATIVCGHNIGEYAFIGAGAVITKDVMPYALMVGNPARQIGWMSEMGCRLIFRKVNGEQIAVCPESGQRYKLYNNTVYRLDAQP